MKKLGILAGVAAAIALSTGVAFAEDMEDCKVVKDGKGLIKAGKADCKAASHDCAGHNKEGDAESFIKVPKGQCEKINAGDFSGVSKETKEKIEGAH